MFANGNVPFNPQTIDFSALAQLPDIYRQSQLRSINAFDSNGNPNYQEIWKYSPQTALEAYKTSQVSNGQFGTPIYGIDKDTGQPVVGALQRQGAIKWYGSNGGEVTPTKGVQFLNTGSGFTPADKLTGQPVAGGVQQQGGEASNVGGGSSGSSIPIDVKGAAAMKAEGQSQGTAAASIPDVLLNAQNAVQTIDEAINSPGREIATGKSSVFDPRNYFSGTEAYGYANSTLKKVSGTSFLAAIQQMRGLGSLSDAEGRAATAAQAALITGQTDEDHLKGLRELKALTLRGVLRTYQKAGQQPPADIVDQWKQAEQESGLNGGVPSGGGAQTTKNGIQWSIEP